MSGHVFVRPGQVAPDLQPPDACVRCGLPAAAHVSAELAARRTAAAAVLADFGRYSRGEAVNAGGIFDWQSAAQCLAAELGSVLQQLGREPRPVLRAGSFVGPDGTVTLAHEDLMTVLGALSDAAAYRDGYDDSVNPPLVARYRALAYRLGDDR